MVKPDVRFRLDAKVRGLQAASDIYDIALRVLFYERFDHPVGIVKPASSGHLKILAGFCRDLFIWHLLLQGQGLLVIEVLGKML